MYFAVYDLFNLFVVILFILSVQNVFYLYCMLFMATTRITTISHSLCTPLSHRLEFPAFEFQPRLAVSKDLIKLASDLEGGAEASSTGERCPRGAGVGSQQQQQKAAGGGAGSDPAVIRYRPRSSIPVRSVVNTG